VSDILSEIQIEEELFKRQARLSMAHFVAYTNPKYQFNWHHKYIIKKLEAFARGEIKRLMILAPPRHGKSELASRILPGWIFGQNPSARIIACSYSADLASDMNADVQRVMTAQPYHDLFPDSSLNTKSNITSLQPKRNASRFDIVNNSGYYISTGVGGPITGKGADFGIIDDPVKNKEEAFSPVFREKVWQWYTSTFYTRLEGEGAICLIMTPWHEDDLAGRLLKQMKDDPAADQWDVVRLPAIKDNMDSHYDPRQLGDPLWPDKYDIVALSRIRSIIQSHFQALYQLRPSAEDGNIIKKEWFGRFNPSEVRATTVNFYIDTAYTDNKKNDRTAILAYFVHNKHLYIRSCRAVWKNFPDLIKFLKAYVVENGYTGNSRIYIEPKASGKSVAQQLKAETNLNIIEDKPPSDSKEVRVRSKTAILESGRVLLPEDALWVGEFLDECATFPNSAHDDQVDALMGAINLAFATNTPSMSGHSYDDLN
jgi:predicted phage terminase large subunit-like protein